MRWWILVLALIAGVVVPRILRAQGKSAAGPFLSPVFTSHMVLQRDMRTPIWGWTVPGARVTVAMAGQRATVRAGQDGRWQATLGPFAAGGPYTLSVSGPEAATLDDVLVGDVWVCSGQSNMEFGISQVKDAPQEIASANYPQVRLFLVPHSIQATPQPAPPGGPWRPCTPENIARDGWGGFSAAAYFFGRKLHQDLNVPIGLIETSFGGTPAESWMSRLGLQATPGFLKAFPDFERTILTMEAGDHGYASRREAWYRESDPGSRGEKTWAAPKLDTSDWKPMTIPAAWEDSGLPDFDGIVWFRRNITLPPEIAAKDLILRLSADDRDTAFVNGVRVGFADYAGVDRRYTVRAAILHPGVNTIAVRVLDTGSLGGLTGTPDQFALEVPGAPAIPLTGEWLYKAGPSRAHLTRVPERLTTDPWVPTSLYNGMIAPLVPYGIKGAIWYQGESNADRAYQYRTLLPALIEDWRATWGQGSFPFYVVQLANFGTRKDQPADDEWAELREAQAMTVQRIPNTGMACAIDVGEAKDIHPKNKQEVGRRLALAAEAQTYGRKVESSGPTYRAMKVEGNAIRLSFDHVGGGLLVQGGRLAGFAVAGADRKFVWADAKRDGNTVLVSSPDVPQPVAVRYAWAHNPEATLYNKAGLPAPPFRTDDWPGITAASAMPQQVAAAAPRTHSPYPFQESYR